ncbi:MAG: alpha/beta hydrolase [Treponema sp.]|jgi:acetyl esterase/lipase|nr:alpha/beta hydrolase [Treponema sp.]
MRGRPLGKSKAARSPEAPRLEPGFEGNFEAAGSVIICPGGAYRFLSPREAEPVARRFLKKGWRPYILRYSTGENLGTAPLEEAAEAVRLVREQDAATGGKGAVVLCGFSAGGHLAASLGVHWNNAAVFPDAASRSLQRPDALVLAYPVISAGAFAHRESIDRLAGTVSSAEDSGTMPGGVDFFSLENHAGADTPPSFIWHTAADEMVPVENSILFAKALIRNGIETELHIFSRGPHGLSLATPEVDEPEEGRLSDTHVARWFDLCVEWLNGLTGRQ